MDAAVGRLVQVLRDTGLLDNTLVRTIDGGYCCCCCCLSVWSKNILSRLFSLLTMGLGVYRRAKARFSINIFYFPFCERKNSWIERVAPRACSNAAREQLMRWPPRKITNTSFAENAIDYDDKWSQKLSRDWLHWRQKPLAGWVVVLRSFLIVWFS